MADPFNLVSEVWQKVEVPLGRYLEPAALKETKALLADHADAAARPRIMVFGTYNAGKSTLINALVGEEVAPVADHPETAKVTSYSWNGYTLDDTPGIDAPIKHEKVTRKRLESADAVLFVLAIDGTLEEMRSYDEIMSLVKDGKAVRLILNNKAAYPEDSEDLRKLREKFSDNLRTAAEDAQIENIEELVPIRVVNAASALRGRLEDKQRLLDHSGIIGLEQDLQALCQNTGPVQMARTAGRGIEKLIEEALSHISLGKSLEPRQEINQAVAEARAQIEDALNRGAGQIEQHFHAELRSDIESQVEKPGEAALDEAVESMNGILVRELGKVQRIFAEHGIETDVARAAEAGLKGPGLSLPRGLGAQAPKAAADTGFGAKDIVPILTQLHSGSSEAGRRTLQSNVAGAGPLLELLGTKVGHWVGPALQVLTFLYRIGNEQEAFERAKEERLAKEQKIADAAGKLRWRLEQQTLNIVYAVFAPVETDLARERAGLKGQAARCAQDQALLMQGRAHLSLLRETWATQQKQIEHGASLHYPQNQT